MLDKDVTKFHLKVKRILEVNGTSLGYGFPHLGSGNNSDDAVEYSNLNSSRKCYKSGKTNRIANIDLPHWLIWCIGMIS